MAESSGALQNNGRIRWWARDITAQPGVNAVQVAVDAYFESVAPYSQYYNGSKSWSGFWGSGSSGQAYNLGPGARVKVMSFVRNVTLTDSAQSLSFTVVTNHFFGSTSSSWSIRIPPRFAIAPKQLMITRASDTSHRLNWSRGSDYSSVVVHRSTNDGAWVQVARPSGNAFTWTDGSTKAGNKYAYRVAGIGGSGQSGWSNTATVYTSPLAPSGVAAERSGSDIVVDASGRPAYASTFNIRDGSTVVASGVSLPWVHVSPAPAETHQYTVQGIVSGLAGAWSDTSNTVQLISQPSAPSALAPNGGVAASDVATLFKWKHNPVDASPQSAGEMQYRVKGVTAWTKRTVTTAQQLSILLPAAEYEWQVRTKGVHASWSPWSAVASLTLIDRPGVAVTSPWLVWAGRTVTVKWSWLQAQGRPQSAWEVEISSADGVVQRRTGAGATASVAMSARLADGDYMVTVRAATGDVWSEPAVQGFTVMVPPAAPADMSGVWSEESGAVTIEVQDGRGPARAAVTNHFVNPRFVGDGTWVEVFRNLWRVSQPSVNRNGLTASAGVSVTQTPEGAVYSNAASLGDSEFSYAYTATGYRVPVEVGKDYSWRVPVRNVGDKPFPLRFASWIGGSGQPGRFVSATLAPGESFEIVVEGFHAAEGSTDIRYSLYYNAGDVKPPAGSALLIADGTVLSATATAPRLCNGDMSNDADLRPRWLGAAGDSETVLEGERVRGMSSGAGSVFIVSEWEGKPAGRLINVSGAASSSFVAVTVPTALRGTGGVFVATRNQIEELTFSPGGYNLMVGDPSQPNAFTNQIGSVLTRLDFGPLASRFSGYFGGRAFPHGGDVWWTDPGMFEPGYSGPAFHGSTGLVDLNGSWMAATWDGVVDNSTSTIRMAPAAVRADIERSTDGGETWVPFMIDAVLPLTGTDTESLSNGVTLYRVTTYSADDATSVVVYEVASSSKASWISGGDGFAQAVRLPYDPEVSISGGRERVIRQYSGRARPVTHSGEATTLVVDYSGTLLLGEHSPDAFIDLAMVEAEVFLYRDPDSRLVYGVMEGANVVRTSSETWSAVYQLTQTER